MTYIIDYEDIYTTTIIVYIYITITIYLYDTVI